MLPMKVPLSRGNSYLGWIRCNLLGKNTYKYQEQWVLAIIAKEGYSEVWKKAKVASSYQLW
jgi:hypothetical protein